MHTLVVWLGVLFTSIINAWSVNSVKKDCNIMVLCGLPATDAIDSDENLHTKWLKHCIFNIDGFLAYCFAHEGVPLT